MQRTYQFTGYEPTRAEGAIYELIAGAGRRRQFGRGAQVMHQGDAGKGFWLIESGELMACRFGARGERIVYAVLGAGDLIGELACFGATAQQIDAIAESDCSLVWLDLRQIDHLLDTEPRFVRWLLVAMADKLRAALDRIEGNQSLGAEARIARALLAVRSSEVRTLALTQQELADLVGVSRVTAGKVLNRLAAEGAIRLGYARIELLDAGVCARFAD